MRRINEYTQDENGKISHIKEWVLDTWYEKVVYTFGAVYLVFCLMLIVIGFLQGLATR